MVAEPGNSPGSDRRFVMAMAAGEAWKPRRRRPPSGAAQAATEIADEEGDSGLLRREPQSGGPALAQEEAGPIDEGRGGSQDPWLSADPWERGRVGERWHWDERPWDTWSWPTGRWGSWGWDEPQPWWTHQWGRAPNSWWATEWHERGWWGDGRDPGEPVGRGYGARAYDSPQPASGHPHVQGLSGGEGHGEGGQDQGGDLPGTSDESWFNLSPADDSLENNPAAWPPGTWELHNMAATDDEPNRNNADTRTLADQGRSGSFVSAGSSKNHQHRKIPSTYPPSFSANGDESYSQWKERFNVGSQVKVANSLKM